jgi:hypothetical protein
MPTWGRSCSGLAGRRTFLAAEGPWLAGDSTLLRSRPPPARCRFRSPEMYRLVGTLLARIPEVKQECPRRFVEPPPASRDPFPQIPAFECRCIPAGFVALPRRTAAGTPRSGASPVGAHRPSRCSASSGTDPCRPVPRVLGSVRSVDMGPFL